MNTKTCTKCGETKELSEFSKEKRNKDGINCQCKSCIHSYITSYRALNKTRIVKNKKNYSSSFVGRFNHWRGGAKKREIPFELTIQDLKAMPLVCHYTGKVLTCENKKYTTISLDRLDSSKGYTKDNVVFCCGFINFMKSTLTYDQFIYACKLIAQHHDNKQEQLN